MIKEANEKGITTWVEPFVGGANMIDKVPNNFKRIGIDYNAHTIEALITIRDLVDKLPNQLTEDEYKQLKGSDETTFIGYGKRNAQKQNPKLPGVKFINGSYDEYSDFENCLIYCDPPYEGTTSYKTGAFDHPKFWDWCRKMSEKNLVFVSEYKAPDDFICVWEGELKTNFASRRDKATHKAVEKLFRLKPSN